MLTTQFIAARALLLPAQATELDDQLTAWKSQGPSSSWSQTAFNIQNETALEPRAFAKLFTDFIKYLPDPEAWKMACRENQFAGRLLPTNAIPAALGRLILFNTLFSLITGSSSCPESEFRQLLAEADDKDLGDVDPALLDILREIPLGSFLMWSTFDEVNPHSDPFDSFDQNAADCCTRLGLHGPKGITCILLAYYSAAYRQTAPKLRFNRPTVADADGFELYRPYPDPDKLHGMTHPTAPNPKKFPGRPEIVHKVINGQGLAFKIRVAL